MFVRLGHLFLILALLVATGSHWTVLQTVAWTNMLANNLRTGSMEEALTRTFDGKHPCQLCKQISAGKSSEQKAEFPVWVMKLEFVSERAAFVFAAPGDFRLVQETRTLFRKLVHQPPVPPPRTA